MLTNVSLRNFKGISQLNFKPQRLNILVGRNNSGKTTVLEAIDLMSNNTPFADNRGMHLTSLIRAGTQEASIGITFNNEEHNLTIRRAIEREALDAFSDHVVMAVVKTILPKTEHQKVMLEFRQKLTGYVADMIDQKLRYTVVNDAVLVARSGAKPRVYFKSLERADYDLLATFSENLVKYITKEFVRQGMNKKIDNFPLEILVWKLMRQQCEPLVNPEMQVILLKDLFGPLRKIRNMRIDKEMVEKLHEVEDTVKRYKLVADFDRLSLDFVTFRRRDRKWVVPFDFLGDGFKALVGLLWAMSYARATETVVLLDEPSAHLHPGYIANLLKILIEFGIRLKVQLFIATHSRDLIERILDPDLRQDEQAFIEKECLFLRMRSLPGHTIAEAYNYKEARYEIEKLLLDLRGV